MKDLKTYATDDITPTMAAFAEWLQNETGYEVDARTVALAGTLRSQFQASDWWKQDARNYKSNIDANREAKAAERIAKAQDAAKKAQERAARLEADLKKSIAAAKAKADALAAKADAKADAKEAKAA